MPRGYSKSASLSKSAPKAKIMMAETGKRTIVAKEMGRMTIKEAKNKA